MGWMDLPGSRSNCILLGLALLLAFARDAVYGEQTESEARVATLAEIGFEDAAHESHAKMHWIMLSSTFGTAVEWYCFMV